MSLQQSTTFGPFVGEFVVFSHIAFRASNHDIFLSVRSATRKWYDVIPVVFLAFSRFGIEAFFAPRRKAVFPVLLSIEIIKGRGETVSANRAMSKVFHSMFTSHYLPDVMSASDGKNRYSGATLADGFIIPQVTLWHH